MNRSQAESIALQVFQALASDEELLQRFFALSGLSPESLREVSRSSGFLTAILDFVSGNERDLLELAQRQNIKPEDIMMARSLLSPQGEFD